jgi:hypothetical protein
MAVMSISINKFMRPPCCYYRLWETGLASNFVKIGQFVQDLKGDAYTDIMTS